MLGEIERGSEGHDLVEHVVLFGSEYDWKLIGEFHTLIIHDFNPKSSKCNGLQQRLGQLVNWPRAAWIFYIVSMCNDFRNDDPWAFIIWEFKWIHFMTVASPRKTRTRKTAARKVSTPVTPKKVTATVRKVKAVKAVKVTAPRRPSSAKLITPSRYVQDIKARWAIHNYEIAMLLQDFTKLNTYVRQFAKWTPNPHKGVFYCYIINVETQGRGERQFRRILNDRVLNMVIVLFSFALYVWRPLVLTVTHPL